MTTFRCEAGCNSLDTCVPFKLCSHCVLEIHKLRLLAKDMDKRFNTGHPDLFLSIQGGVNALVKIINEQRAELEKRR